eukprot:scaffold455873_cov39-Prasinocladus_malaysianus.AAC.1
MAAGRTQGFPLSTAGFRRAPPDSSRADRHPVKSSKIIGGGATPSQPGKYYCVTATSSCS